MQAAVCRTQGSPDVVEVVEVDKPEPGLAEIRIKVQAAALNPTDASAWRGGFFPAPPEGSFYGLGWDIAGVVDAVGPGTPWQPGQRVIALSHGLPLGLNRAQAEYVVVPSNAIAEAPEAIYPVHASTIPLATASSYTGGRRRRTPRRPDCRSAGRTGLRVRLRDQPGVHRALGTTPVRYGEELVEQVLKIAPDRVDAVLDTAGRGSLATAQAHCRPRERGSQAQQLLAGGHTRGKIILANLGEV